MVAVRWGFIIAQSLVRYAEGYHPVFDCSLPRIKVKTAPAAVGGTSAAARSDYELGKDAVIFDRAEKKFGNIILPDFAAVF